MNEFLCIDSIILKIQLGNRSISIGNYKWSISKMRNPGPFKIYFGALFILTLCIHKAI